MVLLWKQFSYIGQHNFHSFVVNVFNVSSKSYIFQRNARPCAETDTRHVQRTRGIPDITNGSYAHETDTRDNTTTALRASLGRPPSLTHSRSRHREISRSFWHASVASRSKGARTVAGGWVRVFRAYPALHNYGRLIAGGRPDRAAEESLLPRVPAAFFWMIGNFPNRDAPQSP